MSAPAMSSAKKFRRKSVSCLHVSRFPPEFFYRAKPASETERQRSRALLRSRGLPPLSSPAMRSEPLLLGELCEPPPSQCEASRPPVSSANPSPAMRSEPTSPELCEPLPCNAKRAVPPVSSANLLHRNAQRAVPPIPPHSISIPSTCPSSARTDKTGSSLLSPLSAP